MKRTTSQRSTAPRALRLALAGLLSCAAFAPIAAPAVPPTDAEELRLREQQQERERERQLREPSARREERPSASESTELPEEQPCFTVRELKLEGDDARRFGWLRAEVQRYAGRCLGVRGIGLIADRLTGRLVARGYVTSRIGIPEQRIADGVVRFVIVPGVIRSVRFSDPELRGSWRSAFPGRPGDLLQVRDLDQGVEQFKRVPSQDADLQIQPGSAPGESDVVVTMKRQKFWRGSLSADDSGSKSTGKRQATASVSIDNSLALNDLLSLTLNHDIQFEAGRRGTEGASLYYSIPWGYWTFTLDGSANRYHQRVDGAEQSFEYKGANYAADVKVQRVVVRTQASKTTLQLGLDRRWARTWLEDTEIKVQRRDVTAASLDLMHRTFVGPATIDGTLAYRQGLPWLSHAGSDEARGFHLATLDLSVTVPLEFFRYALRARAQYSPEKLAAADQFSIGSRYTVRGFDGEQTVVAEKGWFVRNELAVPIWHTGQEVFAGADYGQVYGPSASDLPGTRLAGAVVGARGGYRFVSYEGFVGWALLWPRGMHTARPTTGFMVTCQF